MTGELGVSIDDQVIILQKRNIIFIRLNNRFTRRREFQATLEFRPIRDTDSVEDHQITVCVRKRPLNKKELARKEVDVITVPSKDRLIVHEPKQKVFFPIFFFPPSYSSIMSGR